MLKPLGILLVYAIAGLCGPMLVIGVIWAVRFWCGA